MGRYFIIAGILFALLALAAPTTAEAQLLVTISTDKEEYSVGEALEIRVTVSNSSPGAILLKFTGTQAMYMVMDRRQYVFPETSTALPVADQTMLLEGKSSFTWTFRHRWEAYDLPMGVNEIVGRVNAEGLSASKPVKIKVIDPPPPMKSFVLNFETLPETKTLIKELGEYRAWCVKFKIVRSPTGDLKLIRRGENDFCLGVTSAKLPTGYNIAADLTVQTHEVSADVSIKPGTMIKMIARGDEGKVLDEVISPEFKDPSSWMPLKVVSKIKGEYIRSVEFWPSDASTQLQIDNLSIKIE